ncbi:MAG: hypothetical protein ACLFPA_08550 [Dichotomicrobium sp.]
MDFAEHFQTLVMISNKVDGLWQMYIGVHLGIFWLLFFMHRPLLAIERLIALIAYTFFAAVNGKAMIDTYALLDNLRVDLLNSFPAAIERLPQVAALMDSADYSNRMLLILISHGLAWVLVVLTLAFRNQMIKAYQRQFPGHAEAARAAAE